ncbi:MAG: DHA2 family efflux MFS transporter permease subunit [Gordonia sp. (in: high G+C Gram-positive bacteria)]
MSADGLPSTDIAPQTRRVAWALIAGLAAPILDTTIVTIALDRLARDFDAPVDAVGWISTGYLLALAVAVPLSGWAATRFGDRVGWISGLVVFLAGSVLCAASWNVHALICFRILQGFGAGLLFPLMTSILVRACDGAALGRVVAMVSLPTALGPILGPVIGGIVLNWCDWRWLFVINIPICVFAMILARRIPAQRVPAHHGPDAQRFDWVGLVLLGPGLVGILLALSNAHNGVTHKDVLLPGLIGVVLIAAFVVRAQAPRSVVLVDIRALARRPVATSSTALFFFGVASFAAMFVLPLFFQQVRGQSVLGAALLLIPQGIGALVTRSAAGRLSDAFGGRPVAVAGFMVVALATIPFACADAHTCTGWLMAALLLRGAGLGALLAPIMATPFVGLPASQRNDVSVITRVLQQLGGSFGTALLAVVLADGTGCLASFHAAFWWSAGLAVFGAIAALSMPTKS